MRLRTYESFGLLNNGILTSYPSLYKEDESCEVLVVGGGITGALVSHALVEKGYRVILIDKRDIAMGSTAATTSLLQYEVDVPLYRLSEMIGEQQAVHCYRAGIEAIHQLHKLVKSIQLPCGFEMKQSLFVASEQKHLEWLKKEFEIRSKHQLGVRWIEKTELMQQYGIHAIGGICSEIAASVDAYQLTHQLIAYNVSRGMKVYDQTSITEFNLNSKKCSYLLTSTGCKVHYQRLVFCTGYEALHMLKEKIARLFYTYACVSEQHIPLPDALKNTLVWDTTSPYFYLRSTDDHRLVIGGEDTALNFPFFQQWIKERKALKLQKKVKQLIPGISFMEDFSWAGKFGSTKDGLPYIGKSPEFDKALFALGFGGNGITFSVQAMQIISDLLEGTENALARPYRFGR